ncbi:FAD-dependent monooxygenase [Dactylosporangium sp. NPDC049525]|uniref:FAD-dependent monooxygenase n=1 Tax=Dactylosporangium sp. NPDC049525 TaxID=3154730 RepID=UPI003430C4CB
MRTDKVHVAVVGAGIAGLTVAAALNGAGVHCQVYEQTRTLGEVGAGIQISPNATRLLLRLGLGPYLDSVGVRPAAIEMRRWDSDAVLMRTVLGSVCESMYGAPYYSARRADLHRGLLRLLPPGVVRLGRRLASVEERPDDVVLRFDDGSTVTADVVVGADGIHSVVRDLLVGDEPRFSGQTVYRGLVPSDRLPRLLREPKVLIWLGPGQHCVCYPVWAGRSVSFVATIPADGWQTESWTAAGRVEDVLTAYTGWNDQVREVVGAADTVTRWAIHDRDTVQRWSSDRVTLVGDAAHPMLPFGAQGANQAIEDAAALAVCLRAATTEDIPAALKRYEEVRRPRTEAVHRTMRENARNHHLAEGEEQRQRDQAMDELWGLRGQAWLYGYDAEEAVGA